MKATLLAAVLAAACLLTACGGGGDDMSDTGECPAPAAATAAMSTIPATPCGTSRL